jgi:hypothetical protein
MPCVVNSSINAVYTVDLQSDKYLQHSVIQFLVSIIGLYRYIQQTKSDGIRYWRKELRNDLPHIPLECRPLVSDELDVPYPAIMDQLVGYIDAARATCARTRCSMGAGIFCMAVAAVMYRATWIIVICTSSMEAEFMVWVRGAMNAWYLRSILQ